MSATAAELTLSAAASGWLQPAMLRGTTGGWCSYQPLSITGRLRRRHVGSREITICDPLVNCYRLFLSVGNWNAPQCLWLAAWLLVVLPIDAAGDQPCAAHVAYRGR